MMKNKIVILETYGYVATFKIGNALTEILLMQYGECGNTFVGCVKNNKTRTALDCTYVINSMLHCNKKWRLL